MATTIKLEKPISIIAGKPLPKELIESGALKMPFEATGMKCKNPESQKLADLYKFSKSEKAPKAEKVEKVNAEKVQTEPAIQTKTRRIKK